MQRKYMKVCIGVGAVLAVVVVMAVYVVYNNPKAFLSSRDALARIIESGKIRLLTANNANSYYIYRGAAMGYEYELAHEFAKYLGVELEVVTPGWNNLIPFLTSSRGDLIGSGMTVTKEREKVIDFSDPYMDVQQKIIHHKLVYNPDSIEKLAGKRVHVRRNTSYHARLKEIQQSGVGVEIVLHDNLPTEELIRMVAEREISFTVADSNIALLNRRYFPDMRIGLSIQEKESLAWGVEKSSTALLAKINAFFRHAEKTGELAKVYEKYYRAIEIFDYFDVKKFHERLETRLPRYVQTIRQESIKYGFDWRLVAALVYQESHFNPKARSHTGVRGLMQVTLTTAREMEIENRLDPKQSLKAGIRYLHTMYERFDGIEDPQQRLYFAMASYNIGYGHIRDAQQLAVAEGLDEKKWSSMNKVLPYLMKRKYYKRTRYGYARGREAMTYVARILTYYDILKRKAKV